MRLVAGRLVVLAAGVYERHAAVRAEALGGIVVLATARRAEQRINPRR
jgi:hypothetical protein